MKDIVFDITVTNLCNGNCKYCFQHDSRTPSSRQEELKQLNLLKKFCEEYDRNRFGMLEIGLWGGEPMVNYRFLREIIETTYRFDFVSYRIYSNGNLKDKWDTFLNEEFIQDIRYRIYVRLSYDGEPHNMIYRGNDGKNTLELYRKLRSLGISTCLNSTIDNSAFKYMSDIWDSFERLYEEDDSIMYIPCLDTTSHDVTDMGIFKNQIKIMAMKEYHFFKKHNRPLCSFFDVRWSSRNNCNPNVRIAVHTDGGFYHCEGCGRLKWAKQTQLGNTDMITDIGSLYKDYIPPQKLMKNEECEKCEATGCFVCNAAQIENPTSPEDQMERWESCRTSNKERCRYYRIIGRVLRSLIKACDNNSTSYIENVNLDDL